MKISLLKNNTGQIPNLPKNPRFIKDARFDKLVQSVKEFPKMMELRPIVYVTYENQNIVIGGNMRLKALTQLGLKEVPESYLKDATGLTIDEQKRFVIADNVAFGNDDFDLLANEWEQVDLEDWGMELPSFEDDDIDFDNINSNENRDKSDNTKEITCPKCSTVIQI